MCTAKQPEDVINKYMKYLNCAFWQLTSNVFLTIIAIDLVRFRFVDKKGPAALLSFLEYINKGEQDTKNGVEFLSKSTATDFRVTLSSVLSLLDYVTKELGYRYLMTSCLSQDPIENLFEIVSQSSGCNDYLTPEQFSKSLIF